MVLTKELITERLEAYKRDLQTLQQRCIAVEGAIADCNYWISQLEVKVEDNGKANSQ